MTVREKEQVVPLSKEAVDAGFKWMRVCGCKTEAEARRLEKIAVRCHLERERHYTQFRQYGVDFVTAEKIIEACNRERLDIDKGLERLRRYDAHKVLDSFVNPDTQTDVNYRPCVMMHDILCLMGMDGRTSLRSVLQAYHLDLQQDKASKLFGKSRERYNDSKPKLQS